MWQHAAFCHLKPSVQIAPDHGGSLPMTVSDFTAQPEHNMYDVHISIYVYVMYMLWWLCLYEPSNTYHWLNIIILQPWNLVDIVFC